MLSAKSLFDFGYSKLSKCATTSVSVSLLNLTPAFCNSALNSEKFSIMPLWITAISFDTSV